MLHVTLFMVLKNLLDLLTVLSHTFKIKLFAFNFPNSFFFFLHCFIILQHTGRPPSVLQQSSAVWDHQAICKRSLVTWLSGSCIRQEISPQWRSIRLHDGIFIAKFPRAGVQRLLLLLPWVQCNSLRVDDLPDVCNLTRRGLWPGSQSDNGT